MPNETTDRRRHEWLYPDAMSPRQRAIERLRAELTFWRDGLSAKEVADNMKLWDGKSE